VTRPYSRSDSTRPANTDAIRRPQNNLHRVQPPESPRPSVSRPDPKSREQSDALEKRRQPRPYNRLDNGTQSMPFTVERPNPQTRVSSPSRPDSNSNRELRRTLTRPSHDEPPRQIERPVQRPTNRLEGENEQLRREPRREQHREEGREGRRPRN
jgi:hypothetical protein